MGRERHSDTVIPRGGKYTDELHDDDTRYGSGTTHRGLPPKRGTKPADIRRAQQEGMDEIER